MLVWKTNCKNVCRNLGFISTVYKFKKSVGKADFWNNLKRLSPDNQANTTEAFDSKSRYLNDLLNIDNDYFE